jgi:hypothetical protein
MIHYLLGIVLALSSGMTAASALECRAELPPAPKEYWSWRIIDGQRCWYPGRPGMSKEMLWWPRQAEQRPAEPKEDVGQPKPEGLPFAERWPY